MTDSSAARRGPYAKGIAKREEILEQTLEVIAREGYRGASVKELAEAVGLTQAGLLYYFSSKEELFAEVLRKRDEMDSARFLENTTDMSASYVETIRHNAEVPGLVQLFSQLAADAADPGHPAHQYFIDHGEGLRAAFTAAILARREHEEYGGDIPPETLARIFQAVADGMQLQWLQDPTVDMADVVEALFSLVKPASSSD